MLRKLNDIKKRAEGFTIIEVLIVLAIAALILVIVLIAIPQLQRNQRNTARKSILGRVATEMGSYSGNNNGKIVMTFAEMQGFASKYLGCATVAGATPDVTTGGTATCNVNISDPKSGNNFNFKIALGSTPANYATFINAALADVATTDVGTSGVVYYVPGVKCDGEQITATGAGGRDYVFAAKLEGGAVYCIAAG